LCARRERPCRRRAAEKQYEVRSVIPSGDVGVRNPITGIADCCARAASGHAAAPPSSVMNSRRLMSDMGLPPAEE